VQWKELQWPKLPESQELQGLQELQELPELPELQELQGQYEWKLAVLAWALNRAAAEEDTRDSCMVSHGDGHGIPNVPLMTMQLGVGVVLHQATFARVFDFRVVPAWEQM
jgi:hypothetical protein